MAPLSTTTKNLVSTLETRFLVVALGIYFFLPLLPHSYPSQWVLVKQRFRWYRVERLRREKKKTATQNATPVTCLIPPFYNWPGNR